MKWWTILLTFCHFSAAKEPNLINSCGDELRLEFSCCFDQDFWDKSVSFCLLNDFECIVIKAESADFHIENATCSTFPSLLNQSGSICQTTTNNNEWQCFSENIHPATIVLEPETFPEEVDSIEPFDFKVQFFLSNPKPQIRLTRNETDLSPTIEEHENHNCTYHYKLGIQPGQNDFELGIRQPGFSETIVTRKFQITFADGASGPSIGLILGILLPLCLLLGGLIAAFVCYKKRLLCFGRNFDAATDTASADTRRQRQLHPENLNYGVENARARPDPSTNHGYVEDSNFTDIDLTDHGNERPMSDYILRTVEAR